MWKPIDKELEQHLASEVARIVKSVCPHAVVTYTTCRGYPLDIELLLEVYNVSKSDQERLKVALHPFMRDAQKRLRGLLGIFYFAKSPPEEAKPVNITAGMTATIGAWTTMAEKVRLTTLTACAG